MTKTVGGDCLFIFNYFLCLIYLKIYVLPVHPIDSLDIFLAILEEGKKSMHVYRVGFPLPANRLMGFSNPFTSVHLPFLFFNDC